MFENSSTKQGVVWGGLLIAIGLLGLVDSLMDLSLWVWIAAMGGIGVLLGGVYLMDRSEWWPLVPAYILIGVGVLLAAAELELLGGALIAPLVLTLVAIPFIVTYYRDRTQWWPLIPSYVLIVIAVLIALTEIGVLKDAWFATFVLAGIGLPFLIIYLRDRQNWWALIPAYVMFDIGLMVGLIDARLLRDTLIPAYIFLSIALPFLVVYLNDTSQWWPLIPGGIMALMGVIFLMTSQIFSYALPVVIILAGAFILGRQFMTGASSSETDSGSER